MAMAALLVVATGCSTGDDATSASTTGAQGPSFEAWHMAASDICTDAWIESAAIAGNVSDPSRPEELSPALEAMTPVADGQLADIEALGTPTERAEEVEALIGALRAQDEALHEVAAIARTGDRAALATALGAPELQQVDDELAVAAAAVDLPECGPGDRRGAEDPFCTALATISSETDPERILGAYVAMEEHAPPEIEGEVRAFTAAGREMATVLIPLGDDPTEAEVAQAIDRISPEARAVLEGLARASTTGELPDGPAGVVLSYYVTDCVPAAG